MICRGTTVIDHILERHCRYRELVSHLGQYIAAFFLDIETFSFGSVFNDLERDKLGRHQLREGNEQILGRLHKLHITHFI